MAFLSRFFERMTDVRRKWGDSVVGVFSGETVNRQFWEDLEEMLIAGDTGIEVAEDLVRELQKVYSTQLSLTPRALLDQFSQLLVQRLEALPHTGEALRLKPGLNVLLMVGVNGSGKTTTAGKLSQLYTKAGKKVMLAAADTFRAAAAEQLQVWGERAGVRVVAQRQGSDAAAVAFDGINAARAEKADLLIIDTAGRLQARQNHMEELGKIWRVAEREVGRDHMETFIVLDAVIGQNAFVQAELFNDVAPLTGAVLAKYDSTARGGIVLAISQRLGIPIRYVGLGEAAEDLELFDAPHFVEALLQKD